MFSGKAFAIVLRLLWATASEWLEAAKSVFDLLGFARGC
jgi:hypothetical protein